jgi:hypothetical protein
LTSLYARLREAGGEVDFRGLVEAVAGQGLLVPQARFLLPPPAATAEATLPVTPALECAITPLKVEVQIERPAAEVDPTLADMPEIKLAKTLVPPLTKSAEKGEPISYVPFAEALAEAYGQRLRVASGPKSDPSAPPRLYVVRFEAPGAEAKAIEKVKLGTPASYFAVPPLCTELVSRTAAIRIYQSGSDEPLPAAKTTRAYQAVDVESWVEEALAAIDLVLSPAYAAGAFSVTRSGEASSAFDELVAAKKTLAESISNGALGVLEGTGGNKGSAAEALRQRLDASLVDGFATDAVLQLPTTVEASFGSSREDSVPACADAGGHRLAGKMQVESLELFPRSLEELASLYGVHVAAIARLLGATPNLLVAGTRITLAGKTWTIAAEDALLNGVEALGLGSLDALANAIAQQKPLFREGATVTIDAYSTTTGVEETLVDAAEHLDSPVEEVAVASQSIAGLLPLGAKIYLDGVEHEVTDAMTSLQGAAQELSLGVDVLGKKIAQQAVLAGGKTLRAVRWLPSHSLSPGKIDLDVASGTLDLLLGVEQRSQYRRLLLNLDFRLSGLEYGIEGLPAAPGYERSDWLQFVTPLDEGTATAAKIETDVGKLEVPVPLRAYPVPPRLVSQTASASYDRASVVSAPTQAEKLRRAKAWTYEAVFEVEAAAQDVLYFGVGFNLAPPPKPLSIDDAKDPFEALAEFSANYPRIGTDLANLLLPPDKLLPGSQAWKAAKSAVQALATIAAEIAENWGRVKPGSGSAEGAPTPQDPYEFRLQSRTRSGAGGEQVMDSLVLESTLAPAKWGPRAEPPELAYLDERGKPVTLERGAAPWSGQVIYRFPAGVEVPAFRRRTYAVRYPGLDPVQDQNARASVWLTRNEALVDAARTDSRFVYRTPEIHFHDPIAPSILRAELIGIGEGGVGGLDGAVTSLFEDLLGSKPVTAATMEKLAIRYGWRVAAPEGDTATKIEEGDLVLFTPIAFRPQFAYEAGAPAALATAVEAWLTENPRPSGQVAVISFDLTLFSSADAGAERPLVELKRLDYRLSG